MQPADRKSGMGVRRAPELLELSQGFVSVDVILVAQIFERFEKPFRKP
jgi:hypothetical protein